MKVRFNELPPRVREQLIAVTTGQGDPRVLASAPGFGAAWLKYVTAIAGLAAVGYCFDFLFGRGQQVDPYHDREVYAGLVGALFVAAASIIGIVYAFVWKAAPYREGRYVFHSGLVRLRYGEVELTPIHELGRPTIVQVRRNGVYQHTRLELGGPFTFYFNGQSIAEEACTTILRAKASFARMLAARDQAAIYQVDPFAECSISGQWKAPPGPLTGPTASFVPPVARWGRWVGALLVGVAGSAALYAIMDDSYGAERAAFHRDRDTPRPR